MERISFNSAGEVQLIMISVKLIFSFILQRDETVGIDKQVISVPSQQ